MTLQIQPLPGGVGAAIRGVDLSKQISDTILAAIDKAYGEYGVVFFSGQQLTPADQIAFSRRFGALEMMSKITPYVHPDHPEIVVISNIVVDGKQIGVVDAGQYWHTDVQFLAKPSRGSILYAIDVPTAEDGETVGETMFADQSRAYGALSDSLKQTIRPLRARHSYSDRYKTVCKRGIHNRDTRPTGR
jgi:taurine dioxygenase